MRSFCSAPQKPNPPTQPTHSHTTSLHFLQVIAQGGRKSGSVASYMGLVPGRDEENRGERGGLFDLLAASVLEAEWSRWAPITSPSSLFSPPAGHTHEYNRWRWIPLWLCFQGVVFEVNGSIRLCFAWSFSGHQHTPIKIFAIVQRALEKKALLEPSSFNTLSHCTRSSIQCAIHFVNESLSYKFKQSAETQRRVILLSY